MSTFLKIKGIETLKYKSAQFAKVLLFLPGENLKSQQVYILFKCKLHLVKGF